MEEERRNTDGKASHPPCSRVGLVLEWERKLEARCLGKLGMEWVARGRESARGPNSGWKVPRQGCRAGVCGCAGMIRVGRGESGADEGLRILYSGYLDRGIKESKRFAARKVFFQAKLAKKRARTSR